MSLQSELKDSTKMLIQLNSDLNNLEWLMSNGNYDKTEYYRRRSTLRRAILKVKYLVFIIGNRINLEIEKQNNNQKEAVL